MGGGPPCFPQGFSCLVVLWHRPRNFSFSLTGLLPPTAQLSSCIQLSFRSSMACPQPQGQVPGLGSFPFARRYSENRSFFLFLRVLRCFSSPGLPPQSYLFKLRYPRSRLGGFPHSDISGSLAICAYPELFAAYRVLLRLLVPRHPPCALCSLT